MALRHCAVVCLVYCVKQSQVHDNPATTRGIPCAFLWLENRPRVLLHPLADSKSNERGRNVSWHSFLQQRSASGMLAGSRLSSAKAAAAAAAGYMASVRPKGSRLIECALRSRTNVKGMESVRSVKLLVACASGDRRQEAVNTSRANPMFLLSGWSKAVTRSLAPELSR